MKMDPIAGYRWAQLSTFSPRSEQWGKNGLGHIQRMLTTMSYVIHIVPLIGSHMYKQYTVSGIVSTFLLAILLTQSLP
jgi:hypothetical protein